MPALIWLRGWRAGDGAIIYKQARKLGCNGMLALAQWPAEQLRRLASTPPIDRDGPLGWPRKFRGGTSATLYTEWAAIIAPRHQRAKPLADRRRPARAGLVGKRGTRIVCCTRRRQGRPRPDHAVLPDLIKKPGVKAARQQPFDAIAAPENPPPFEIAVFQIDHIIASASQIGGADRQRAHSLEPAREMRIRLH